MKRYMVFLCASAALAAASGAAQAASLTVTDISGAWTSWAGGTAVAAGTDGDTAQLRWGIPTRSTKSGYDFTPASVPLTPAENTDFDLGTFSHNNFPIASGTGIDSAALDVSFTFYLGTDSNSLITRTSRFVFDHWETANAAAPCADGGAVGTGINANGCADRVRAVTNPSGTETFEVVDGDVTRRYFFAVTGFDMGDAFWTKENAQNTATLRARYLLEEEMAPMPAPLPLPAAGWMLVAGLGAFAATGRRRRDHA